MDVESEWLLLDEIVFKDRLPAQQMDSLVHGGDFISGFIRLVRYGWRECGENQPFSDADLASYLHQICFKHAANIKSTSVVKTDRKDDIENTAILKKICVEKAAYLTVSGSVVYIYFNAENVDWLEKVKSELGKHFIAKFLPKCVSEKILITLKNMLCVPYKPTSIGVILSDAEVPSYDLVLETHENSLFPSPGTFISESLHNSIDKHHEVCSSDDYRFVALELEDPVISSDETQGSDDSVSDKSIAATYIFVHILGQVKQTDDLPLLREYFVDDGSENPLIVKGLQLYRFVPKDTSDSKDESSQSSLETALLDVKNCVQTMNEKVDKHLLKSIFKRLLLKWCKHQDFEQILKFLKECFEVTRGSVDVTDSGPQTGTGPSNLAASWYDSYLHSVRTEVHALGAWRCDYASTPYPYPSEARRWLRQAQSDLSIGVFCLRNLGDMFNWTCYMAHQAAEKALKAAWYFQDANQIHRSRLGHNIVSIASGLNVDVHSLTRRLSDLTGEHTKMRYPDALRAPKIPSDLDVYSRQKAEEALDIAHQIFERVQARFLGY